MRTSRERGEKQGPDKPITLAPPPPTSKEAVEDLKPLGHEAPEVVDEGAQIGAKRLGRPLTGSAITAFIGGMSVSFGAVAMVWAAASPVGFIILLIGKSELFTENFFLPVTAILERHGDLRQLAILWGSTLTFNLLGGLIFALLNSRLAA